MDSYHRQARTHAHTRKHTYVHTYKHPYTVEPTIRYQSTRVYLIELFNPLHSREFTLGKVHRI